MIQCTGQFPYISGTNGLINNYHLFLLFLITILSYKKIISEFVYLIKNLFNYVLNSTGEKLVTVNLMYIYK